MATKTIVQVNEPDFTPAGGVMEKIRSSVSEFVEIRHSIHSNPELGFEEHKTSALVAEKLSQWGYEVHKGLAGTGVVGTLKCGDGSKRLGLRADMDALPMSENSGKPWASSAAGLFHGCGHDGHTAILLCAAKYLAETKNFDGTLHVIFQPAEELLYGGRVMIEDGLFKLFPCDAVFSIHNMPSLKTGEFYFREGGMMSSSDTIHIEITGKGAHAAQPERGIDATVVACYIATALQSIVSRNISPLESAVLTIGCIQAGDAPNMVNNDALMKLSVRALSNEARQILLKRIDALVKAQAASFGATAEIKHINGSPALVNNPEATRLAASVAAGLVGESKVHTDTPPFMASEDFAFMAEAVPYSSYIMIGNGDEPGFCNVHNPGYDFNDECIVPAASLWAAITEAYLKKANNK